MQFIRVHLDVVGRILTTDSDLTPRWIENFKNFLNQHFPLKTIALPPASKELENSVNTPMVVGVIRPLKNDKAIYIDVAHAEMLKVDLPTVTFILIEK